MDVQLRIRRFGKSLGIVFPKDLVAHLKVAEGDNLLAEKTVDGLKLTPVRNAAQMKIAKELMDGYRNTLRTLAEH